MAQNLCLRFAQSVQQWQRIISSVEWEETAAVGREKNVAGAIKARPVFFSPVFVIVLQLHLYDNVTSNLVFQY